MDRKKIRRPEEMAEKAVKAVVAKKASTLNRPSSSLSFPFASPSAASVGPNFVRSRNQWLAASRRSTASSVRPRNSFACGNFGYWKSRSECSQSLRLSGGNTDKNDYRST